MSKNHPHDNIYSILGKLEALKPTPEEKRFALVKEIRESVEAQGSILSGVDAVQAKLAQQFAESKIEEKAVSQAQQKFMGMAHAMQKGEKIKGASPELKKVAKTMKPSDTHDFAATKHKGLPQHVEEETCNECGMYESECGCDHTNEGEITRKHGVTTHRKTDFPGYPVDDADDIDDENKGKRGRPRKHAKKEPTGLGRGRPKKDKPLGHNAPKMHDPFGRVGHGAEKKSTVKGRVHSMDEAMTLLGRRLVEGMNFKQMAEETDQTIDELMNELQQDILAYKKTGHCSEKLGDFLKVHAHSKKQHEMEEAAKAAQLPVPPAMPANPHPVGSSLPASQIPGKEALLKGQGRNYYEEEVAMEDELNELARLAGLDEVSRGEYIKQKDTEAEKSGKDKFQAFGQEFDTDEVKEDPEAEFEGAGVMHLKAEKAKEQGQDSFTLGDKEFPVKEAKEDDVCPKCECDPCECDDEKDSKKDAVKEAQELIQMLRIAGLDTRQIEEALALEESKVKVDKPDEEDEPANKPKPEYKTMRQSTMNPGEADSGEKAMHPDRPTFKNGDNALAKPANEAMIKLEARLAAEYESIKKVSK